MSLVICGCDRGFHFAGDPACPGDSDDRRRLLKGMAWGLALSLPIDAAIVWAVLKLAGVL